MEDPERDQRRAVRRRRRARLRAAELGRSRGGLTSKVHLAVERRCRPLSIILTPGQAADSPRFIPVLKKIRVRGRVGRPRTRPDAGGRRQGLLLPRQPCPPAQTQHLPEKADQAANRKKKGHSGGRPVSHDATLYKDRNTVERAINKFKEWRGLATRYDKTPESYAAGLHLRGSILWLRSLPALP
ncbi:transposase [Streptomyces hawaiiensis]|uniref:transposase n=2 Tax=Streptomyces TaxID=1883 RepID=UPI003649FEF9